jgi:predicted histidine transporter YuiF (NhaC family)
MKLKDVILLSLSAALVIVGTHITMTQGVMFSYPIFMLAVLLLLWFKYRKARHLEEETQEKKTFKKHKKKKT